MGEVRAKFVSAGAFFIVVVSLWTSVKSNDVTLQTILWWTEGIYPHYGVDETVINCGSGSCLSSKRRERKDNPATEMFLFYGTDFREDDVPLPRSRQRHLWALLHEESPLNNFLFSHSPGIQLFNYTATFRRSSDFPLSTQFIPNLEYITDRLPVNLAEKNRLRKLPDGIAPLVYVQSHCHVPSDRDRYVSELSRFIAVDSYGSCLHNRDLPEELDGAEHFQDERFLAFLAKYKFHLAFENALCPDYQTEKLFRAFHVGSVPVYRGSSLVRDWEPSHPSVVVVDDFDSPRNLAEFLRELDTNDTAYSQYLSFKGTSPIANAFLASQLKKRQWGGGPEEDDFVRGFECFVCDALLKRDLAWEPKYANSSFHMGCPEPHPSLGDESTLPSDDQWLQQAWSESYWYAYDLARALNQMVRSGGNDSSQVHRYALAMKYKP